MWYMYMYGKCHIRHDFLTYLNQKCPDLNSTLEYTYLEYIRVCLPKFDKLVCTYTYTYAYTRF